MLDCIAAISCCRLEAACLYADRWQWTAGLVKELSVEKSGGIALSVVG